MPTKGSNPALLRALYIILVPVVALIVLLNTGWLQRLLPAVTVHGERYTVVRYNFYYFDCYNAFLEENETRLDALGYDPKLSDSQQTRPDGSTWKEYFQAQAEASLAETAYYCDLAQAAGYSFTEEEHAPVAERLAANEAQRLQYGITSDNYYVSYYGPGMNEARYTQELTRKVQAQAYKAHLIGSFQPDQEALDQWLDQHPQADYRSVDLRVITLDALPDRATGQVGAEQLDALAAKLGRLTARYAQGVPFAELQASFSSRALGDEDGALTQAIAAELPGGLADWCLTRQEELAAGDTFSYVDTASATAYFALLEGFGPDGPALEAAAALGAQAVQEAQEEALADGYQVEVSFGMTLATK